METIKLTLSEWLVKELSYYKVHHQIDIDDLVSKSVAEYLNNNFEIVLDDIITSNNNKLEISVEIPKGIVKQLQTTANEILVDCSDIVFTALAFTVPNLINVIEMEEEIQNRGKYGDYVY